MVFQRASQQMGSAVQPPTDQPDGDRRGGWNDGNGVIWWMASEKQAPRN